MQPSLLRINNPPCVKMDNGLKTDNSGVVAAECPTSDLRKIPSEGESSRPRDLDRWDGNTFSLFWGCPKTRNEIWQPELILQISVDFSCCWRATQKASRAHLAARNGTFLVLTVDACPVLACRCSSLYYPLSFRHWSGKTPTQASHIRHSNRGYRQEIIKLSR